MPDQADQEQPVYYAPNTLDDFTGLESLAAARNVGGARPIARGYQVAMGPYKQPITYQGQTYVSAEVQAKLQKQQQQQAWIAQQKGIQAQAHRSSVESEVGPLSEEAYTQERAARFQAAQQQQAELRAANAEAVRQIEQQSPADRAAQQRQQVLDTEAQYAQYDVEARAAKDPWQVALEARGRSQRRGMWR